MLLVPCPACGLPRTAADTAAPCPACRWADHAPPPPASAPTSAPPPAPEPPRPRPHPLVAGGLGVAVGVLATLAVTFALRPDPPPEPVPGAEPELAAAPLYPRVASLPVAPPPRLIEPDDDEPLVVPVPIPVAADGGFATLKIDRPDDPFHFPKLGPGNKVKLTGRVKKLYVEGLEGGAELDATGLANEGVYVTGLLDSGAVLKAKTDGGTVSFKYGVRGASVVDVDAPKAAVAFATYAPKAGPAVGGGSRVTLRAKSVSVALPVDGTGTVVDVTFSRGGSLKLDAVTGGAVVRYRPEHRADPPLKLTPGRISGGELREEPPP